MKRSTLLLAAGSILLAACGPTQVVVTAEIEVLDPATNEMVVRPLSDLEVMLLPYDRDMIFDSLSAAFGTPEPEIPAELVAAREAIQASQARWRGMQDRWNTLRDSLQTISSELERYSRGEGQYITLFRLFGDVEDEYNRIDRQQVAAFEEFTSLQEASNAQTQEVRVLRDNWAAEAFADIDATMLSAITASGLDVAIDTTDASGITNSLAVKPGSYWVHARVEEAYTELYWNMPLNVVKGDPITVTLTRSNAEVRPKL